VPFGCILVLVLVHGILLDVEVAPPLFGPAYTRHMNLESYVNQSVRELSKEQHKLQIMRYNYALLNVHQASSSTSILTSKAEHLTEN
jgi:hypothetical protein